METQPWMMEQMAKSRMEEAVRRAAVRRLLADASTRAEWSRQFGEMLIRVGQRLAARNGPALRHLGARSAAGSGC